MASPDEQDQSPLLAMRAWIHNSTGPPRKVLKFSKDVPVPQITTPSSVLVRISHAALNPGPALLMHTIPFVFRKAVSIPELDFAGTIISVGSALPTPLQGTHVSGTAVFGSIPVPTHLTEGAGSLAEYVVVEANQVVPIPDGVNARDAAGLGVAGTTAIQLIEKASLRPGMKVLIYGASGGIGTLAMQLAKNAVGDSGRVVCCTSPRNHEMIASLGADAVSFHSIPRVYWAH